MTTTLASAAKKLQQIEKANVDKLPKKLIVPSRKETEKVLKEIEKTRKQVALNRQSNADILSQDSYSTSVSHSSDEDSFVDRELEDELAGQMANFVSNSEDEDEEEDDDDDSLSADLEEDDGRKQPSKRPRPIDQVRRMMEEQAHLEKKRKTDAKEQERQEMEEKLRRMEHLEIILPLKISEYEHLRKAASDLIEEAEKHQIQLEAAEKSSNNQVLFVLDQEKVSKEIEVTRMRMAEIQQEKQALEEREKGNNARHAEVVQQFTLECDCRMKEIDRKTYELEEREKALNERESHSDEIERKAKQLEQKALDFVKREKALEMKAQQLEQQSKNQSGSVLTGNNILRGFISEMREKNQNTIRNTSILGSLVSQPIMNSIATMALGPDTPSTHLKTYSFSNSQYSIIEVESATDGTLLFSQVVAKSLYNAK